MGARLPDEAIVGLDGPLGVGKTILAKGLASGLGVPEATHVISPAYNLVLEYDCGPNTLVHIDFFRLNSLSPADTQMFTEILERPDSIVLVEWASKFLYDLADGYLSIVLDRQTEPSTRLITIQTVGETSAYTNLIREIKAHAPAFD